MYTYKNLVKHFGTVMKSGRTYFTVFSVDSRYRFFIVCF